MHNERQIIKWAAGVDTVVDDDFSEEIVVEALWRHKLTGRCLTRIERDSPSWVSDTLTEQLREQQRDIQRGFDARLEELKIVADDLRRTDENPLILKGVTAYGLTGDTRLIRRSGDIDLLPVDPCRFNEYLVARGYGVRKTSRNYQYGTARKDAIKMDIHVYFPVVNATDMDLRSLVPKMRPGKWTGLDKIPETELHYDDMLPYTTTGLAERTDNLCILSPVAASLLLALHAFREFAHEAIPLPYATIRLGDLVEIRELIKTPGYDLGRLRKLTAEWGAYDSVQYVGHMIASVFGTDVLGGVVEEPLYPYDLWRDGFCIAGTRAKEVDQLLIRDTEWNMSKLISELQGNDIRATRSGPYRYAVNPGKGSERLDRVLVQRNELDVEIYIEWSDVGVAFVIETPKILNDTILRVLVNFGDHLHEVEYDPRLGKAALLRQKNHALGRKWRPAIAIDASNTNQQTILRIELPWDEAMGGATPEKATSLLLGVREISALPYAANSDNENGLLIPMEVKYCR